MDPNKTPIIDVGGALQNIQPKVSIATGNVVGVQAPVQSPTGIPVISPKATPYIAAATMMLGLLQHFIPGGTIVGQALSWLVPLGSVLLGVSPGLRLNSLRQ